MMPMLFHDGYANNSEGIFDYNGKIIKDAKAVEALGCEFSYFSEGLIRYRVLVSTYDYSYKYGYRDKNFNIVVEAVYDDARPFSDGVAAVYDKQLGLWGYIDKTGKVALPFRYGGAYPFSEGLALVSDRDIGVQGFINKRGEMIIPNFRAGSSCLQFSGGLFFAGKVNDPSNRYSDTTFGVLDINGNFVESSLKLRTTRPFSEGLAAAQDDASGKWGYVDKTGKWAIEPKYYAAHRFSEGLAAVSSDPEQFEAKKFGFIDKSGKMVIPDTDYRGYYYRETVIEFHEGLCAIYNRSGNLGYIDKTGKTVIPFRYNSAMSFKEGHAWVYSGHNLTVLKNPLGNTTPSQPGQPGQSQRPPSVTASPTASTVLVNGKNVAFDAYNIGGNNYFKLRDLAYTLNGTNKQFAVRFDSAANTIFLTSGAAYSTVGGEMQGKGSGNKTATVTTQKIVLDGKEIQVTGYNIGGNNYFMLRDIGAAFNFSVVWDGARNTIIIDTSKSYR